MKCSLNFFALTLFGLLTLSQCTPPPEPVENYQPAAAYQGSHPESYRLGYRFGRSDATAGEVASVERYSQQYLPEQASAFREGYEYGFRNYQKPGGPPEATGLTAQIGQGTVTVLENGSTVSTIKTAMPNIEAHHFTADKRDLVVKSRGVHGPATVELFDARSGRQKDKVLAYTIRYGEPAWARGMQD